MSQSERNFYITGLPRCRTAWFANLFTGRDSFCFHEALSKYGFIPDRPDKYVGTAETDYSVIPEGRTLIVLRDPQECLDSVFEYFDVPEDYNCPLVRDALLNGFEIAYNRLKLMNGLHVEYDQIDMRLYEIWEFLLPDVPVDLDRLDEAVQFNVQVKADYFGDL